MPTKYKIKLLWVGVSAVLFGVAYWKNTKSYPTTKWYIRLVKAIADVAIVVLMAIFCPGLLIAYIAIWLTGPFENKHAQAATGFASMLLFTHLAGVALEFIVIAGLFAIDLVTGQVLVRTNKRLKELE